MKTTLHGELSLVVYPTKELPVTVGGRAELCRVRGVAVGRYINVTVTLDVNSGEILLFSPDDFVGSFRLGDLVVAQVQGQLAQARMRAAQEACNAA